MFEQTVVRVVDVPVPQIQEQMEVDSIILRMRVSEGVEERLVKELMDFAVQQNPYDRVSARVVELLCSSSKFCRSRLGHFTGAHPFF